MCEGGNSEQEEEGAENILQIGGSHTPRHPTHGCHPLLVKYVWLKWLFEETFSCMNKITNIEKDPNYQKISLAEQHLSRLLVTPASVRVNNHHKLGVKELALLVFTFFHDIFCRFS
jgi:hypothetical protein